MSRCLLVGLGALLLAQKPYFQQRVEYRIQVKLFPIENLLRGYLRLTYQNNSPDTLSGLYFHLWPNAYSRRGTAFDRQQRIMGKTSFYFAAKEERGFMDSLSFQVEGETVKPLPAAKGPAPATGHSLSLLRRTPDVVWVPFPRPLPPGKAVVVETPFRVKIPKTFSRMGRQGLQYAITQWYPKPAVYDHKGWHPLPYLDQGEFYSEWGKYEVEIEVPENFFVAATGRLETPEVQKWIQQRETETRRWIEQHPQESGITEEGVRRIRLPFVGFNIQTPAVGSITSADLPTWARDTSIAPSYKKLRFVQDSIHDFAWFADPRYGILSDTLTLPNGHRVACVSVFHLPVYKAWQHAPQYIAEAIEKLSQWVGPYPYDHATAVESSLEAGGGMEYPMITVIIPTRDTSTLRQIVVHEVGHNWFQGLLGSNERLHPWQDEGINSYYEKRILSDDPLFQSYGSAVRGVGYETLISVPLESAFYHHLNADVAPGASSYRHSILSYALGVYQQTSVILRSAAAAYTPQHWDTAMQHYFRKWAFRHPYPEDWATSLSEKGLSGEGLLRYLETDREVDIRLHSQRMSDKTYRLQLEEPTRRLPRPFWVEAVAISRDGQIQESYRLPLDSVVQLSLPGETYTFLVNPQLYLYERRTGNNFLYTRSLFPTWRKVRIAFGYPKPFYRAHVTHVGLFPAFGYNYRDGLLLGLGAYHGLFPKHTGEFHLLPMYSFLRQDLRGSAGFTLRAFPGDSRIQLVELHLRSASFAGFWRTKASLEATLRRRYDRLGGRQILRLRSHHLAFQNLESRAYTWINSGRPAYLAVDWEGRREDPILNLYGMVSIGHDLQGHTRAEAEGQLSWQLLRKWTPWMRGYVGWVQKGAPDYLLLRPSGYDAFGEAVLLDRFREGPRLLRQQIPENQGGWRTPTDTLRSSILIGGNAELPLPKLSFVRLRLDGGYLPEEKRSYWGLSLGLPVVRIRGRFLTGGYFPLLGSSFPGGKPSSTKEIIQSLTWSVQIPLDSRWLVPW